MTHRTRCAFTALVTTVAALSLASCVSSSSLTLEADYPAYETPASLAREAVIVIEGTVLDKKPTVLLPRYDGNTPEENPYLGASDEERQRAVDQDGGIPGEAVTLRADVVYRGDVAAGDEVVFIQTGGVLDDVRYELDEESDLQLGDTYLLFGMESFDGAFTVLGGSAGTFVADGDRYVAVSDAAPVEQLTSAEVRSLLTE